MSTLPVIAAVDGSDDSLRALDWALAEAHLRVAPLRVVHVRQYAPWMQPDVLAAGPPHGADDPVLDRARAHLDTAPDRPATEYVPLDGSPTVVLPELASAAQLLVLGSRGRGGFASLLLGSTSLAAARDAECPVVVVPRPGREIPDAPPAEPGPRVVVGLQVDSPDDATLEFAFTEAARRKARLQVIAAYPWPLQVWTAAPVPVFPPAIEQEPIENETRALAEGFLAPHRTRHPDVETDPQILPGDAAGHLVAMSANADLLVVGRYRRRLLAPTRMLGSVSHAVLLHAACPIAVVPPTATDE
ncbi:universal stress protein [Streptomyces sp. GXMU-J15]|uniref:Universal stress protein n=1 Tax=Streptomyces fuscus TaxID=3048495 RepID=A0ABT7IQH5_9ACTN|nr:universal stress protein [Streptomyces fuscus]MDL2074830.1 universal stress protein [Streptomyces fuscus]